MTKFDKDFNDWLDRLVDEKGLDRDKVYEVEGPKDSFYGVNLIPLGVVVDAIKAAPANEKAPIKDTLVKIDFLNGDVEHFFRHLAKALAV